MLVEYIQHCLHLHMLIEQHGISEQWEVYGDRLCGLVVRVPGYTTVMYCVSCEVRTEFMYVM
jgi:hypothetical protein